MRVRIYDATLTEGARAAEVQFSVRDKLRIALRLGEMGITFIEAGWPGNRPGDADIFRMARRLSPAEARLAAVAELRLAGPARKEPELGAALRSDAPVITIGTTVWARRVGRRAARAPAHLAASVSRVCKAGREAVVDLGDFFDVFQETPGPALAAVEAASRAGAEVVLLSDTLGGALPVQVEAAVAAARRVAGECDVGIRARNDAGLAVACSLAAIGKGASVVAGTVNGYGERCGAADLLSVLPALELKLGHRVLADAQLRHLTSLSHFVAELADLPVPRGQPYVGRDAFPQEEGRAEALRHVDPERVGNRPEPAMSDERGHSRAMRAARELGLAPKGAGARRVIAKLAEWERRGFRYEGAEASFELLLRALAGRRRSYFRVLAYRTLDVHPAEGRGVTEASVEVAVGDGVQHTAASGVGPVHALDRALRKALEGYYPELKDMRIADVRSRNLSAAGTAAAVRVLIESADGRDQWGTAGVSEDLIEACCQALADAIEYKLAKDDVAPARAGRRRR